MFKILYLSPVSFLGGAEESLCTLLKFLDRKRFEPLVVLPDHGPLQERLLKDKVRVEIIPWGNINKKFSRKSLLTLLIFPLALPEILILFMRLRRLIKREGIDLIHTNGLKSHFLGGALAFWTKVKIVWHIREIYSFLIRAALKCFRRLSRAEVIAISGAVKEGLGISPSHVIYNGVDTTVFYPVRNSLSNGAHPFKNLSEELGFARGTKIITMLGALTPWKGQHIFLEAIAALYGRFPEIKALIVGEEIYTGIGHRGYLFYLKDKVKKLGIENQVRFLGFRDDIPYIINSSLAVVHASLRPEPFGRVLIEAMACGKAVIAAKGGAVEEIVRDRVDGLIVEKGNPASLAQAISALIENGEMAGNMGEKGRQRIEELFTAELMERKVENFYRRFLEESRLYNRR